MLSSHVAQARWSSLAAIVVILTAQSASAIAPRSRLQALRTRSETASERARPPSPPAPRVALQLSGLHVTEGLSFRAALHSIARDAWPQLVACIGESRPRGVVHVALEGQGSTLRVQELSGTPVARNPALRACITTAVTAIHPPPSHTESLVIRFELSVDMPAIR
ncbi:MAG: hypothetical protein Q8Q09_25235 [Deltaproteobacteria bacterium]|nr:hypothetical protein [Deltaproteobacteria bacterium]